MVPSGTPKEIVAKINAELGTIMAAEGWLAKQRTDWEKRLDQLDDNLENMKEQKR